MLTRISIDNVLKNFRWMFLHLVFSCDVNDALVQEIAQYPPFAYTYISMCSQMKCAWSWIDDHWSWYGFQIDFYSHFLLSIELYILLWVASPNAIPFATFADFWFGPHEREFLQKPIQVSFCFVLLCCCCCCNTQIIILCFFSAQLYVWDFHINWFNQSNSIETQTQIRMNNLMN